VTAALVDCTPERTAAKTFKEAMVAAKQRFTRIPKTSDLISAGVPTEVIPTYCALADYTNNKTGLCWPKMETLASTLDRSVRTVQRHLHVLKSKGLVEFVERRRNKGRYSSYLYRVVHIVRTTGHGRRVGSRFLYRERTKGISNYQKSTESKEERKQREAKRRREGYEWLFK
jgi:DNA-binding transcriptional ArsR family regulator